MDTRLMNRCELMTNNREIFSRAYMWDSSMLYACAASMYAVRGEAADSERVAACKKMINERVGAFNYFRSTSRMVLASMMDLSGDPAGCLERALQFYDLLKEQFFRSEYLPMSAMMLALHTPAGREEEMASRTRLFYERIREKHPFLTGSEDCAYCAMMALSGRDMDELINDMETTYAQLKDSFFSGNAVQALSHSLSLFNGIPSEKADRTMELFRRFKEAGHKWGTNYELSVLGVLAMLAEDQDLLVQQVLEADEWLQHQRGFGFWSNISTKQRLMYAGLLVLSTMTEDGQDTAGTAASAAAINGTIAAIIAQQAAMTAIIAANAAASASSSSH